MPQVKLLQSPRLQLFMTHCGANSLFEAMYFGKLIIGIPQEIDQYANAYKA